MRNTLRPFALFQGPLHRCLIHGSPTLAYASKKKAPSKKNAVLTSEEKPLFGRPSNNLKIGIVGLPNVGKSLFFNSLTNSSVPSENFPFCTIDPSEARVFVPDPRFDWLVETYKPKTTTPAFLTVIDIAGLVKGASEGQGLGNAFLSHIKAVDGIFHLVRAFEDSDVTHVEGDLDPVRDIQIIHEELRLKDEEFMNKLVTAEKGQMERIGKGGTPQDKARKEQFEIYLKAQQWLSQEKKDIRARDWTAKEVECLNSLTLITAKPVIYLVNLSESDYATNTNKYIPQIKAWIDENHPGDLLIPFSGDMESALSDLKSKDEKNAYLSHVQESNQLSHLTISNLSKIIIAGYKALSLVNFFTCGPGEVRAWTIRKNTKAPQAAGTIHSDFEKAFVIAEVMKYEDLKELGSEASVKSAGKYYQKGKEYVVEDGDIIYFKSGQVSSGKKK